MHHIDIYLDNGQILSKNKNSFSIGHKKIGDLNWKWQGDDCKMKKCTKVGKSISLTTLTKRSIGWGPVDRFVEVRNIKRLLHFFSAPFSSDSLGFFWFWLLETDFNAFFTGWPDFERVLKTLKVKVSIWSGLLFLRCIIVSSSTDLSPFPFVRVLGVSLY